MNTFRKYQRAVNFLESINNMTSKDYMRKDKADRSYYVDRLRYFLKLLNNPQDGFKIIHITGTSGKGTITNYLHKILSVAGFKVGSYFSPHSTTSIERIKVNDVYISQKDFIELVDYVKPYLKTAIMKSPYGCPSYYEIFFTLAFLYFHKKNCDYVVLEAGLGGTYDATNVVKNTKIALITNVGYDHMDVLGNTLSLIAIDKAGIIKKDCTFITTETRPKILEIFKKRCEKVGAKYIALKPKDSNANQILAQSAAQKLGFKESIIKKGLTETTLPCRFEAVQKEPLVIIDGAHNPPKLEYLRKKIEKLKYNKLILIFAIAANKNHKKCLKAILPVADELYLTRFLKQTRKAADLKELYDITRLYRSKLPIKVHIDPWKALKDALNELEKGDLLLITGSFFLAGELRTKWTNEEAILKTRSSFKKPSSKNGKKLL